MTASSAATGQRRAARRRHLRRQERRHRQDGQRHRHHDQRRRTRATTRSTRPRPRPRTSRPSDLTVTASPPANKVVRRHGTRDARRQRCTRGVVGGDVLTFGGTAAEPSPTRTSATARRSPSRASRLSGADAGNYTLNTTADHDRRHHAPSADRLGVTGVNKVYDGTTRHRHARSTDGCRRRRDASPGGASFATRTSAPARP